MSEPALFMVNVCGDTEVWFGERLVGMISEWAEALRSERKIVGEVGAYYQVFLPIDGSTDIKRPATSVRVARRLILHRLADWFGKAGPMFDNIVQALTAQAELEREAA